MLFVIKLLAVSRLYCLYESNYCISQKHETSFKNYILITFSFFLDCSSRSMLSF